MSHVLLVDDDSDALLSLVRAVKSSGVEARIHAGGSVEIALKIQQEVRPQVVVVDLCLDEHKGVQSGFDLIEKLLLHDSACRIIVLTGHGTQEHGIKSIQKGAASFLEKPANIPHLSALINDSMTQSNLRRKILERNLSSSQLLLSQLVGSSIEMKRIKAEIQYAAFSVQPVFISGETGTGKGLCAKLIHDMSTRSSKDFVRYQPNYSSSDLTNSDLFGHKKGSFTGAIQDRKGLIQQAHLGTLFLDEIDELPSETQITLLGVLQERAIRQLGSNEEISVDFRLISASNADMEKSLETGKMRKDFYHRVANVILELPPLRSRADDISEIAQQVLVQLRTRDGLSVYGINDSALTMLTVYEWPGNIRELEATVESAAFRAQYGERMEITEGDLRLGKVINGSIEQRNFNDKVTIFKLKLIEEALNRNNGNQVQAARELGLDRSTMRRLLSQR